MYLKQSVIIILLFLFSIAPVFAEHEARVIYDKPKNKNEAVEEKDLKESGIAEQTVEFINEKFILSQPINFRFGGEDGPLFDGRSNNILIPYTFLKEVKIRFKRAKYAESGVSILDATLDSVMHTLFHELAHALIFMHDIPVVGKEEDAADGLASILLIEFYDEGADIALSAADLFDLESEDIVEFEEADFWDDHSLDLQRFYTTLCHVYGSDPKKYIHIKSEAGFSDERAENCIADYGNLLRSWLMLLSPYIKGDEAELK